MEERSQIYYVATQRALSWLVQECPLLLSQSLRDTIERIRKRPLAETCRYIYFDKLLSFFDSHIIHYEPFSESDSCLQPIMSTVGENYLVTQSDVEILFSELKRYFSTKNIDIEIKSNFLDIINRIMPAEEIKIKNDETQCNKSNESDVKSSQPTSYSENNEDNKDKDTRKEFMDAFIECRNVFVDKLKDYGPSWRIFRPQSVTDQLFIKGTRIRSLEELGGVSAVGEGIRPEFAALVNYGIIGLIQLELGYSNTYDISQERALELYDKYMKIAFDLMVKKNHDYDEAWRSMRVCSYTDFVLVKLARIKQIEENDFDSGKSEGVDSNYLDIINYSIFALIKLSV